MKNRTSTIIIVFLVIFCSVKIHAQVTMVNGATGNVQINLLFEGNTLRLSGGNLISLPYGIGDITNITGSGTITSTNNSGTVTLNAKASTNLWNANMVQGKAVSVLNLSTGHVLKYDGTQWIPSLDNTSSTGSSLWKKSTTDDIYYSDGNIGIGTTAQPDIKLAVKGRIHAKELIVDLNIPGPDYVFDPAYDLLPLQDVESHINEYKHLPGVPSAKRLKEENIPLSEMNMIILKKVEELTLYMIDHEKRINELRKTNHN